MGSASSFWRLAAALRRLPHRRSLGRHWTSLACQARFVRRHREHQPSPKRWPASIRMGGRFAAGRLAPESVAALDRIAPSVAVSPFRSSAASTPHTAVGQQEPKLFARGARILLREGKKPRSDTFQLSGPGWRPSSLKHPAAAGGEEIGSTGAGVNR
jgi:hypothetical protein